MCAAEMVRVGDDLLLRPGELLACDAVVLEGRSHVDASRITGEPVPVSASSRVSGCSAAASTSRVHSRSAQRLPPARASMPGSWSWSARRKQSKSPLQRLADRYAVWFTPLTLAVCAGAYLLSGDPTRVLAVLVVATPCPLILATPVAVVGGINRAARRGIIFRHGTALEQLGGVSVAVFDKTGTLTIGQPKVARVLAADQFADRELLRLAGSVEQGSGHLLARTLVQEAVERGIALPAGKHIVEAPGQGVRGEVEGHQSTIGGWSFVVSRHPAAELGLRGLLAQTPGAGAQSLRSQSMARAQGSIEYADRLRPEIAGFIPKLKRLGIYADCSTLGRRSGERRRRSPTRSGLKRHMATCCPKRRSPTCAADEGKASGCSWWATAPTTRRL